MTLLSHCGRLVRPIRLTLATILTAVSMLACGGGGSDGNEPGPATVGPGTAVPAPAGPAAPEVSLATEATLQVTAQTLAGMPVAGAVVLTSGGVSATTDAAGRADLKVPNGTSVSLSLRKEGFASQVRVLTVPAGGATATVRATLLERQAAQTLAEASAGGTVTGKDGARAEFPAGSLVDAQGRIVGGAVQMQMTPVNILSETAAFPGSFAGTQGSAAPVAIVSYGAAEFHPTQNGEKLQIAPGKSVVIEIPMYADRHQNGSPVAVGQSIPLWSLNESTGIWVQEGTGTVVASAQSPTGFALRATVTHFSWWNCDDLAGPEAFVTVRCMLPDAAGNPVVPLAAGQTCSVRANVPDARRRPAQVAEEVIGSAGSGSLRIPAGTLVELQGESLSGAIPVIGLATVNLAQGATAAVVIPLSPVVTTTLTLPERGATLAASADAAATVEGVVDRVELFLGGVKIGEDASAPYTFRFDTTAVAEGHTTLQARAVRGTMVTGLSALRPVIVDRSPPVITLTRLSPAAGDGMVRLLAEVVDFSPIAKVEFFRGDTKIGEDTAFPFEHTYVLQANEPAVLSFTARAADPAGNAGASNVISFGTLAPTVVLSRTPAEAIVTTSGSVVFEAIAASNVGIARVEFFRGSSKLADDANAPFQLDYVVTGADQPSFSIMARAIDNAGNVATATMLVDVGVPVLGDQTPPAVALDALPSPITTGNVELAATATDDTAVAKVAFLVNGVLQGEVATPSLGKYRLNVDVSLLTGTTTFTAQAFDAAGNSALSSRTASVAITTTLLASPSDGLAHATGVCAPNMGVSADGTFYVTHVGLIDGVADALVSRRVGGRWQSLGTANDNVTTSLVSPGSVGSCPTIGVTAGGQPYVAFMANEGRSVHGSAQRHRMVRRFNGTSWETVRDIPTASSFDRIKVVMDRLSRPVIAWSGDAPNGVTVERFDGSAWQVLASAVGSLGGAIGDYRLAVRPDSSLVIAIQAGNGAFGTALHAINVSDTGVTALGNSTTRIIGGTGDTTQGVNLFDIAATATETVVSWFVGADFRTAPTRVSRFAGTATGWTLVGTPEEQLLPSRDAVLAFDGASIIQVASRTAEARRWNGTSWSALTSLAPVQSAIANLVVFQGGVYMVYAHDTLGFGASGAGVARIAVP